MINPELLVHPLKAILNKVKKDGEFMNEDGGSRLLPVFPFKMCGSFFFFLPVSAPYLR